MAYIEPRKNKKGEITSYRIIVSDGMDLDGKQIRRIMTWTPTPGMSQHQIEKELNAAAVKFEEQIEYGYQLDSQQTLAEYIEYVLDLKERAGIAPRTLDRYRSLRTRILKALGHMKLSQIRPQHLNSFYKDLAQPGVRDSLDKAIAKKNLEAEIRRLYRSKASFSQTVSLSASTVNRAIRREPITLDTAQKIANGLHQDWKRLFSPAKDCEPLSDKTILEYHGFLSTVFAQAEKELLIPYNPAAKATPPKAEEPERDFFEPEELEAILKELEHVPLKWKTITYLLIDTGCRRGEIMGLKWSSVDLEEGIIIIERALLYTPSLGIYEGPTKTRKIRAVRISNATLELLRKHKEAQQRLKEKNGDRWIETGYVFTADNGDHMTPDSITQWLAKFSETHNLPHIHPHAFRHTAASTMIASGIDLVTTAHELGHANATTTATIYAHSIAVAQAKAAQARSGVFDLIKPKEAHPEQVD